MLIDEQRSIGDFPQQIEAVKVTHRFVQKVAILQAVVIDAGWGERVADEKDFFGVVLLDEQRIVIDCLAGVVVERECKFFLSHLVGFGHDFDIGDRIGSQARQAIVAGAFEYINHWAGCIDGAIELGQAGSGVVCMVVVIMRDEQAFEAGQLA